LLPTIQSAFFKILVGKSICFKDPKKKISHVSIRKIIYANLNIFKDFSGDDSIANVKHEKSRNYLRSSELSVSSGRCSYVNCGFVGQKTKYRENHAKNTECSFIRTKKVAGEFLNLDICSVQITNWMAFT
jgi:hypothetical protein